MFEEYYQCTIHGNIKIKSYDINLFFSNYKKKYIQVFKASNKKFLSNKLLKEIISENSIWKDAASEITK